MVILIWNADCKYKVHTLHWWGCTFGGDFVPYFYLHAR